MRLLNRMVFSVVTLCFLAGNISPLEAATLHVIAVGDTSARDLRSSIELDVKKVEAHARASADYAGMDLNFCLLSSGRGLSRQVLRSIRELKTEEDDAIMFYYSGHGYRPSSKRETPWPNMFFTADGRGLELDLVCSILQEKQSRLVIVMADCCNNIIMDILAPPLAQEAPVTPRDPFLKESNYRKLFGEARGLITMASSQPGDVSYSVNSYGSLYTNAFMATFEKLVSAIPTEQLDWRLVLEHVAYETGQYARAWGVEQSPIFQIEDGSF